MDVNEDAAEIAVGPLYSGGGSSFTVDILVPPSAGTAEIGGDGNSLIFHPAGAFDWLAAGETANVSITVSIDDGGGGAWQDYSFTVIGANNSPAGTPGAVLPDGSEDTPYTVTPADLLAGFSDVDGDTLAPANVTADHGGIAVDPGTGDVTVTPDPDFNGTMTLSYDVVDGQGGSAPAQISYAVAPVNDEPTAPPINSVTTDEDVVSIMVAINASDIDGDTLSYAVATGFTPAHGLVDFDQAAGSFTYMPGLDFNGSDSFTIAISDGQGGGTPQDVTVTVNPVNDPPVAIGLVPGQSVRATDSLSLDLNGLFSDPDGDPLTLGIAMADGSAAPGWIAVDPASGTLTAAPPAGAAGDYALAVTAFDGSATSDLPFTLTVRPETDIHLATGEDSGGFHLDPLYLADHPDAQISVDTAGTIGGIKLFDDGSISYTARGHFDHLAAGQSTTDHFTVTTVADGVTTQWTYSVDVAGANDAPYALHSLPDQYARIGHFWSYTVPDDLFVDPDGDPLVYRAYQGFDGALPDWISFDPATRTYSGIVPDDPALEDAPVDLKIQALDGGATGGTRFYLNISRGPGVIDPPQDYFGLEDQFVFIQLPTDMFDTDQAGGTLTYTATRGNGDPLDDWLHFDPVALTLSGQPPPDYSGGFNVKITAYDGELTSAVKLSLQLADVPDPPTGLDLSTPWVSELATPGTAVGVLTASDSDPQETFHYSLIDDAGGLFTLRDNLLVVDGYLNARVGDGTQAVTVAVTDASGASIQRTFTIDMRKGSEGELFASLTPTREIQVAVTGSDADGDGSADHPYATIQHAVDLATPGTAIMVHAGTYQEALKLRTSGDTDAPIRLISADGQGMAEIRPASEAEVNAIDGQAIQNWVIDGFAITGTDTIGTYGINIYSANNGANASFESGFAGRMTANIVLKDNIVTNWGIDGIHLGYVFNTQVISNTVSGAHEQGIDVVYGVNLVIANNVVDHITRMPAWFGLDQRNYIGDSAITVKGGSSNVQILNNLIGDTLGYGIKVGAPSGLRFVPIDWGLDADGAHYIGYEADHVLVRGNTVLNSANGSLDINAATNVDVVGNLFANVHVGGYNRTVGGIAYGAAETYFPLGIDLSSDTINFVDNVTTATAFRNSAPNFHVTETGTVSYDPNATYDPEQYAFALGQAANWAVGFNEIFGTNRFGDTIIGADAADYIDGRLGADTMAGGLGGDVYVLDTVDDIVSEYAGKGTDTVLLTRSAQRYIMPEPTRDPGGYIENAFAAWKGDFTIIGNSLDNVLTGGAGDDHLTGNGGNDTLFGLGGDDMLNGTAGRDFIHGGAGDDQLAGGMDDDVVEGGGGRDILLGGEGKDFLISFDADNRLWGGPGIDTVYLDRSTFDPSQRITLDISSFGDGSAAARDPREKVLPDGTRLQNVETIAISAGAADDHIIGGYYDDQISAGHGDDFVSGFDGNDLIWGAAGDDQLYGGNGDDMIDGGLGADYIDGGTGNDTITSNEADIALHAGDGVDSLQIDRSGSDFEFNFDGAAVEANPDQSFVMADGTIVQGFEAFIFTGGDGGDWIAGGSRDDKLNGAGGDDTLDGGSGSDKLNGGGGHDIIYGGTGGDTINGGFAADDLWGDAGKDLFTFVPGQAEGDVVHDFESAGKSGGDTLQFTGYGPGATLTCNPMTGLWTVASADGLLHDGFTILGVTQLISSDYTLA